jgi:hypothetical protein
MRARAEGCLTKALFRPAVAHLEYLQLSGRFIKRQIALPVTSRETCAGTRATS